MNRFHQRLVGGFFLWLLFAGLLAGCQGPEESTTIVSQVIEAAGEEIEVTRTLNRAIGTIEKRDGPAPADIAVLDISFDGAAGGLDPQTASSNNEYHLVENLFAGLTRFDHATNEVRPELAEDWQISPDGRVWTFNLRRDIFWIDPGLQAEGGLMSGPPGPSPYRPVIADDVAYAVQRACDPRTPTADNVIVLFIIEGCESVHRQAIEGEIDFSAIGVRSLDDSTVEIRLTEPSSYFHVIATLPIMFPVPREIIEPFDDLEGSWDSLENVLFSGPFVVNAGSSFDRLTILQRNPFWPIPFSGTVDRVNIQWLGAGEAYELWQGKNLDVSPLPPGQLDAVLNDRRLRERLHLVTNQAAFYLAFNFDSEVFKDPAVRRAFGAAIDRERLISDVYNDEGIPMRHFTPPGAVGAPPSDLVGIGYNSDRARLEMQASSLTDCGFLPEIRYLVGTTDLALFHAQTVREMWVRELGCPEEKIIIEQVHFGTLLAATRPDAGADRPDLWDLGWASHYPDAHNWLGDVLHCEESENRQHRPCGEADALILQAARTTSTEERLALYREVERLFFAEGGSAPIAPLYVQGRYILIHPWLSYSPAHFGGEQFDTYRLDATVKRLEKAQ